MLPIVIFLDIDGTLIGDISPQVCEWEILTKVDRSKLPRFKQSLIDTLSNGLLRPHIAEFLMNVKKKYECVEFFVYTASNTAWANFLVPCIEKAIGINFQRPVFARNNCLIRRSEFLKSLDCVMPVVVRKLRPIYPMVSVKALKSRVAIVDNNNVLVKSEEHRCIKCPTYNFVYHYDVLSKLDLSALKAKYMEIVPILISYGFFPRVSQQKTFSLRAFLTNYHERLYSSIRDNVHEMKNSSNDRFWLHLMKVLHKMDIQHLKEASVKEINTMLGKQIHKQKAASITQ